MNNNKTMNGNIIPFRPVAAGLKVTNQLPMWPSEDDTLILTVPHEETCEGITLALLLLGKEITQVAMYDNLEAHKLTRLASYVHSLRKMNWYFIVSQRVKEKDWQPWHHDWEWRDKLDPTFTYKKTEADKVTKTWVKYYIPRAILNTWRRKDEDLMEWAKDTYILWRGDDDLDEWKDAEA